MRTTAVVSVLSSVGLRGACSRRHSEHKLTLDSSLYAGMESACLWQSGFRAELFFVASLHAPLALLPSRLGG